MDYKVYISEQAYKDLAGIFEYVTNELKSIDNAKSLINSLEENIYSLNFMPFRFAKYDKNLKDGNDLRMIPVGNFLILYIPKESDLTVNIVRVIYSRMDVNSILNDI